MAKVSLAKQIRDTKRLLQRDTLPADSKVELERKLKTLLLKQDGKKNIHTESKYRDKYRYVKFVEMTKLKRSIGQLEKSGDLEKLKEEKIRLAYIQHFPGDVKYISLLVEKAQDLKRNHKAKDLKQRILDRIREAYTSNELESPGFSLCKADFFVKEEEEEEATANGGADDFFIQ